ncbi:MAG: hypothetical protein CVU79_04555 [Elusimicrobia bacterium HGW-Elusimicrobia-3]|nr:MAG: hypothetical protein CVU79_04555 [Elusimicrobia bacterium HGW-Elusimicrobia-3]
MEEQVSSHISDLEGLNTELEGFLSDLHGREESLSARVKGLEEELSAARNSAASRLELYAQKEASISAALEELRGALTRESSKTISLTSERDELQRKLDASFAAAAEKYAALLSDRDALLQRLEGAERLHEVEKARGAEKEQLIASGRAALKAREEEAERLLRSIDDLKADLALERANVKDREAQLQKSARLREAVEKKLDLAAQENARSEEGFLLKIELVKKEMRDQGRRADDLERKLSAAGARLEDALSETAKGEKTLAETAAALAEKEAQLRDANHKLKELTREFAEIKSGALHENAARAREAAAAMAARVEELENSLEENALRHTEKFRAVQAELVAVRADLRAREEENSSLRSREETISKELGDAEEKWKFSTAQLNNAASRLRNAENELEIIQGRLSSVEEERDKFRAAAIKAETASSAMAAREAKARDGEAAGLVAALEEQSAKYTDLLRRYDDLVLQREASSHEKAGLRAESDSLRAALKAAQDALDAGTGEKLGEHSSYVEKVRALELGLKKKDFELQEALSAAASAARETEELRAELEEKEYSAAGAAEAEKARYAVLSEKMHNAESLLKKKEFELDEARAALSGLEDECLLLRRSRADLGEKFSREIQAENELLKESQTRIVEREALISRLSLTEEALKKETEALRKEKQQLLAQVRKKASGKGQSKVTEAERMLAEKESGLEHLRAELERTRAEKAELQGREKGLREELRAKPYRAMLREAEEKLLIKEKMLADMNSRMKKIGKDFEELKTRGQSAGAPGYMPDFEELVAGVAHQIANSISIIRSHAEFCAEAPDADGARESLDVIVRNIVNLQKKIDIIMSFSRPVIPQRSPERLRAVVEEVLDGLRAAGKLERINVQLKGGEKTRPLSMDRVRFASAAEQLLLNAAEAMPDGGEISVSISGAGGRQRLEVSDTGPGIEKKNLGPAFHPFFTTKPGKMGLGLTLARNVARAHGGSLELHCEPGRGVRAVLDLPEVS